MKAFADLIAHCPNLKKLVLENNLGDVYAHEGQDDSVLVSLARHCPLVEEIELNMTSGCPDFGLLLLSQNCKNLVKIRFEDCEGFTDTSFEHIAKIQSLQELFCSCNDITDVGFAALIRGAPKLRVFDIFCDGFSAEVFRGLKDAPFVQGLVEIRIRGFMEEMDHIDVIIGESLSCCHNLVKIVVSIDHFGDVGLALMSAGCPQLEVIEVDMSEILTIEGLMHVATKCPRLRLCDVKYGGIDKTFSEAEIEMFKARFPDTDIKLASFD